jgi:hypothetical protein
MKKIILILSLFTITSCSLFGVQNEESVKYKVLVKDGDFEIREYSSYIVAKTTIEGNYNKSSSKAFKRLAGYIFGKNKTKINVAMTSPVVVKESSQKIAMTSPVEMNQSGSSYTMSFSMPSKYTIETLPDPIDNNIFFQQVPSQIKATHRFSWFSSKDKNKVKANELRKWLQNHKGYKVSENYSFAGYNPPWTLPFLKRNEIHIELKK